jgi:hypothetical protein
MPFSGNSFSVISGMDLAMSRSARRVTAHGYPECRPAGR